MIYRTMIYTRTQLHFTLTGDYDVHTTSMRELHTMMREAKQNGYWNDDMMRGYIVLPICIVRLLLKFFPRLTFAEI